MFHLAAVRTDQRSCVSMHVSSLIVHGLVVCAVAASAAAMVSIQTVMVFVTGGICCLNAPSVIHRQYTILKTPSKFMLCIGYFVRSSVFVLSGSIFFLTLFDATIDLRKSIGMLRSQVNELAEAVDFLQTTIDKLEDLADE